MQHTTFSQSVHRRLGQVCRLGQIKRLLRCRWRSGKCRSSSAPPDLPPLVWLAGHRSSELPAFISDSPLAVKYLTLLGAVDWNCFPQRAQTRVWPGPEPQSPLPFVIALLIRIDQRQQSMGALVDLLRQRPELAWLAGFAAPMPASQYLPGVAAAAVPDPERFSKLLRQLSPERLQWLLGQTVHLLRCPPTSTLARPFHSTRSMFWLG